MQATTNQKLSLKDRITAKLPGHKNQDKNMNGIPDRLEKSSDRNGNGIPDALERPAVLGTTTAAPAQDLNRNGIPDQLETTTFVQPSRDLNGNGIPDSMERSSSSQYVAPSALGSSTDLNRNCIPDQLERSTITTTSTTGMTDLNRNGIPDQLETSQGFGFVGSVAPIQSSVVDVREAPVIVEKIEKPAVVHEVYKTEEVVQIQPVIEREREQLDVYEVVQPMKEREVMATEVRSAMLPAQTRAVVVEDNSAFLAARSAPVDVSTKEVMATRSAVVENAPIVHETIVHKVIEEVQPVIYKEVDRPILIKETLPIYERIVEAPHAHHTVLPVRDLGVTTTMGSMTTGFTDLNRNGIPDQLERSTMTTTTTTTGFTDLNRNGIPDQLERPASFQGQTFARPGDLNGNGIPDVMERQGTPLGLVQNSQVAHAQYPMRAGLLSQPQIINSGQFSGVRQPAMTQDLNRNGIPDSMEGRRTLSDLNGNGIPDRMEKAHGLKDLNGNGIDDSLERRMGATTLNSNTRV